ncbi:MAG: hypothetical protein M2R45_03869 [Verrucomicrobia subdivision 3 bacterium]|nr:hypothetical protein [Limisphaerales bacterium]MCS1412573.1 hypothetical protein [Limisphaerales bacterium]
MLALVLATLSPVLFFLENDNMSDGPEADTPPALTAASPPPTAWPPKLEIPSPRQISAARAERERLIREYPDEYYDPDNRDPEYLRKVAYHRDIKCFLDSSRRDDPVFRQVMTL